MKFELDPLPYELTALEPYLGGRTLDIHYNKHHAGYLDKLEKATANTRWAELSLEEILRTADDTDIFRNAAQTWNHSFFWQSMCAPDSHEAAPGGALITQIEQDFGNLDEFRRSFSEAASSEFGSGWAWLVADANGRLDVISTSDADNPMRDSLSPIVTLDVWEHAYYLDYQNERGKYIEAFLEHLINWPFAEARFDACRSTSAETPDKVELTA
jgi:Fe-Mn family superoxide dismutase